MKLIIAGHTYRRDRLPSIDAARFLPKPRRLIEALVKIDECRGNVNLLMQRLVNGSERGTQLNAASRRLNDARLNAWAIWLEMYQELAKTEKRPKGALLG